jgi:hypothetical protein
MSAFLQEGSGGVRFGFTYNGDGAMPRRVAPSVASVLARHRDSL